MGKITSEQAEEMKKRVIANGGSVVNYTLTEKQCRAIAERSRDVSENYFGKLEGAKPKKSRMNKTEVELAFILATRGYQKIQFEGITLELATGAKYTPDFYCVKMSRGFHTIDTVPGNMKSIVSGITFFESKGGFIREAAMVRLKVAARQFPEFTFILAQKKKGVWTETVVHP